MGRHNSPRPNSRSARLARSPGRHLHTDGPNERESLNRVSRRLVVGGPSMQQQRVGISALPRVARPVPRAEATKNRSPAWATRAREGSRPLYPHASPVRCGVETLLRDANSARLRHRLSPRAARIIGLPLRCFSRSPNFFAAVPSPFTGVGGQHDFQAALRLRLPPWPDQPQRRNFAGVHVNRNSCSFDVLPCEMGQISSCLWHATP